MSDSIIQQAIQNLLYVELETYSSQRIHRALLEPAFAESPWLWCWQAMEQRLIYGNYPMALQYARLASGLFNLTHDADGHARANAEVCIAHYHLGQYAAALQLLDATPMPPQATCAASLALAGYLNTVGLNDLARALEYFEQGMRALEHDPDTAQRVRWQIILKRNAIAAYHYRGELATARRLSDEAFQLLETYGVKQYHYTWLLYEQAYLAKQNRRAARQIYNRAVRSKYQLSSKISRYFAV